MRPSSPPNPPSPADTNEKPAVVDVARRKPPEDAPPLPASLAEQATMSAAPRVSPNAEKGAEKAPEQTQLPGAARLRVHGAAFDQYILAEQGDTLYLIDQHAAHERVLYERFSKALEGGAAQMTLEPIVLSVSAREAALIEQNSVLLEELGFWMEPFGETAVRVHSVPLLMGVPAQDLCRAAVDALEEYGLSPVAQRKRDTLVQLACKKAVKGGEKLSAAQIEDLLAVMAGASQILTCPHGRPVCVAITKRELDRRFKRIV